MMWKEFEEIAGYEVSYDDYHDYIEPMYMALPTVTKAEFVKMIDRKRFALPSAQSYMRIVRKEAKHLFKICGHYTDYESERRMEKAAKDYAKRKYGLDWTHDTQVYVYFNREYEFPDIGRGCTYPCQLVIGRGETDYERIQLIDTKCNP